MYFDDISQIPHLVQAFSTTIFVIDPDTELSVKPLLSIKPESPESNISIENVREIISLTETKQTDKLFIIIRHAELLTEGASNALLKTIEEPGQNIHIIFFTKSPNLLLPTIKSRAMQFYLKQTNYLNNPPKVTADVMDLAKRLLVVDKMTLPTLIEEITKKSTNKQENDKAFTLKIIETTIELAYKSYFKTQNILFLKKIEGLSIAYQNIQKNGNKKLQLIANLM